MTARRAYQIRLALEYQPLLPLTTKARFDAKNPYAPTAPLLAKGC